VIHARHTIALLGLCLVFASSSARAQEEAPQPELSSSIALPSLDPSADSEAAAPPESGAPAGEGAIAGTVFDDTDASPELGVEATLIDANGGELGRAMTDDQGKYRFEHVGVGTYSIRFEKPGFRTARMTEFPVAANQDNPGDFALSPESAGDASGVEEIVITAERKLPVADRPNADEFLNTMDTAEIGKFAAADVGDAIKRIPGINVVEGQFAIIRGLEDRYSSTLFNSAPVPSPDPNTQSVQLDLFPSEIASNLVVAKTFAADLPSNSSGGSINIVTNGGEDENQIKLGLGSGYNANSTDRFLKLRTGSPIGSETSGADTIESDVGLSFSGRRQLAEHEVRFKGAVTHEIDYDTRKGTQEGREPRPVERVAGAITRSGDLSLGELNLTAGSFDLAESSRTAQLTGFANLGFDLDTEGNHRIDFSFFYTRKRERAVQLRENGFLPGLDYSALAIKQLNNDEIFTNGPPFDGATTLSSWIARSVRPNASDPTSKGPLWSTSFYDSRSFSRDRDLFVYQLNGDHRFSSLEGLHVTWAANHARTSQSESYFATRFFFEPNDTSVIPTTFPHAPTGAGRYATTTIGSNGAAVDETQNFARLDAEYEVELAEWMRLTTSAGVWYESSKRDVGASFLQNPRTAQGSQFAILGDTPIELGDAIPASLTRSASGELSGLRSSTSKGSREIIAFGFGAKATLVEDFDVLGGVRREHIQLASQNDPFTGEIAFDGSPSIFPTKYLMFDRLDNPLREPGAHPATGTTFNDQLLGIDVPIVGGLVDLPDRASIERIVNGDIDEVRVLPTAGLTWRPFDGMNVRAAYSQTVARPSFREIGYYVTVESGSDDLVVGNPQLTLSDVDSYDARVEYLFGAGELAAVSVFYKQIDRPIESIVIRDPTNFEGASSALYRTFFNNSNRAKLTGVELEARKAFDFFGVEGLQYLSLGANFTYIDASVKRSAIERARAASFFGTASGDTEKFAGLSSKRRLFSQPKWIANADLTFDDPESKTKLTLAVTALSDVLDAAGSVTLNPSGDAISLTLDRYVAAFYQLDLIGSQGFSLKFVPGEFVFKLSVKNLTDSVRKLVWDPSQTAREIPERSYKLGRDVSLSLSYDYAF
jgi:TonB-dependent receptor